MTIELGKVEKLNPYQAYFEKIEDRKVNLTFQAEEIALFYYTSKDQPPYICYKSLPLTEGG